MPKVVIGVNNLPYNTIKDEEESKDLYGEEFIKNNGLDVSEELIKRFKDNYKEFLKIQSELSDLINKRF